MVETCTAHLFTFRDYSVVNYNHLEVWDNFIYLLHSSNLEVGDNLPFADIKVPNTIWRSEIDARWLLCNYVPASTRSLSPIQMVDFAKLAISLFSDELDIVAKVLFLLWQLCWAQSQVTGSRTYR